MLSLKKERRAQGEPGPGSRLNSAQPMSAASSWCPEMMEDAGGGGVRTPRGQPCSVRDIYDSGLPIPSGKGFALFCFVYVLLICLYTVPRAQSLMHVVGRI